MNFNYVNLTDNMYYVITLSHAVLVTALLEYISQIIVYNWCKNIVAICEILANFAKVKSHLNNST